MGYPTDEDFRKAHGWDGRNAVAVRVPSRRRKKRAWTRPQCGNFSKHPGRRPPARKRGARAWLCLQCWADELGDARVAKARAETWELAADNCETRAKDAKLLKLRIVVAAELRNRRDYFLARAAAVRNNWRPR